MGAYQTCSCCAYSTYEKIPAGHNYVNHVCKNCLDSEGLEFTLNEDGKSYSVSKGTFTKTQLFVPNTYNGLPVTSIGNYAFYNCTSLTSIEFTGTVAQWKAIGKGYDWKYYVPATEVVCKDGTVAV